MSVHRFHFTSFCYKNSFSPLPLAASWARSGQEGRGAEWRGEGRAAQQWAGCSGQALYWMPRKRHMAKIIAKSSMASTPMARAPAR